MNQVDVLCIGYACWDLNFHISEHPGPDDKILAESLTSEGGGPAANAAYSIAKLGGRTAFIGRLGKDTFGKAHMDELKKAGVDTSRILFTDTPTSTSSIWVNQRGQRAIVNYRPERSGELLSLQELETRCLLMDGHEFEASVFALEQFSAIPSVLDAGSLNEFTLELSSKITHLVASSTFAKDLSESDETSDWIRKLSEQAPFVAVSLGDRGVLWQTKDGSHGNIQAPSVEAIDTTAAGDIFHGACALALAKGKPFPVALAWANEVAAISVTKLGGRVSSPSHSEVPSWDSIQ